MGKWFAGLFIVAMGISISAVSAESIKETYQGRKTGQGLGIPLTKPPTEACIAALRVSVSRQILLFLKSEMRKIFEVEFGVIENEEQEPFLINSQDAPKQDYYSGKSVSYLSTSEYACEAEATFSGRISPLIKWAPENMYFKIECFDAALNARFLSSLQMGEHRNEEDLKASFREKISEIQEILRKNSPAECQ